MPIQPNDIESIYSVALTKTDKLELEAYLDAACAGKPELRRRIETLLKAHAQAEQFLETPPPFVNAAPVEVAISETPGTVIGRYKLLEKIGEGGMAVVYMAEQEQPMRRKVALKIIKLGMDTKQVIARFEAERQALALMDHSNIAKVLDAGATDTGRPYFVMELVTGVSITEYCDQNSLSASQRLSLFIQVCNAIQHAHQKGIIHRDIKPSNVMVTQHEGKPIPKVIDFGIAKATHQRLTEKTLFTRYAHIIGTPAYMSPEQAELSDIDVDTRSDIYSLGVLLYELLTGTTPFSEEELRKAGYLEMHRVIREQEPDKPSTKLSTLGDTLTDVARQRKVSPDALAKIVRGDLDWIVMKTLAKNRTHRYETANAFAMDIQRYLDSEAVLARGPSASYQLRKFLYRHRVQATVVMTLVTIALGVGIILLEWKQDRAQLTADEAFRHRNILSQARGSFAGGNIDTARKQVQAILPSPHVGAEAQLLYAGSLVVGRQPDEAIGTLEQLLNDRPEIAGAAHALMARILWESPSTNAEKLAKIETHQEQAKVLFAESESAEAFFLRAMTAFTIKEKMALLHKALRLDPSHYESRRLRALTYYASRKYQDLEHDALAMIVRQPKDPLGYSLRAVAWHELGQYEKAIEHYDSAIELSEEDDPQYVELNARRYDTLMCVGQYERIVNEARTCLQTLAEALPLEFRVFCALTALGRYDEANALFKRVCDSKTAAQSLFADWARKYVFDALDQGRQWHPPEQAPVGAAFDSILQAQETYRTLSVKARRVVTDAFTAHYSPDGTKLAYSTGFHGYSGVAVLDTKTGQTDLLMVPGKDPQWSPDGQHLVFVRDCNVLPVSALANAERMNQHRENIDEEVWVMKADGTSPKRLAFGSLPCWDKDPNYIYYYSNRDMKLYKENWRDANDIAQSIPTKGLPSLSPDRDSMAYMEGRSIKVLDLASRSVLAKCKLPFKTQWKAWSRDGRELCFGASAFGEGLWIYSLERGSVRNVLEGPSLPTSVAPDGRRLVFNVKSPYFEIWEADLDPSTSMLESLGPGKTVEECQQEQLALLIQRIEADPNNATSYFLRAQYYDSLGERQRAQEDMRRWSALAAGKPLTDAQSSVPRQVINLPYAYQLVFSAERPINTISMMSIAFGQKGRSKMKQVKMPTCVASLYGLSLALGLYAQPVHADYEFGAAEKLGPLINSEKYEYFPRLFLDGLSLLVSRAFDAGQESWVFTRPTKDAPWDNRVRYDTLPREQQGGGMILPGFTTLDGLEVFGWGPFEGTHGGYDIYVKTRESIDIPFGNLELVNLGTVVNSRDGEGHVTISSDGLELYFSDYILHRPGGHGKEDLWVTRRATRLSPWETPENLGPVVNSPSHDSRAHISMDGLLLFFDSRRPGGHGGSDLYLTRRKTLSDPWGRPANLGPIVNSASDEFHPCISPNGHEFYFSRNEDIWRVTIDPVIDMDGNGQLDGEDVAILTEHWHSGDPLCDIGPTPFGDGIVDFQDLKALSEYLEPGFGRIAHWKLDEAEGDIAYDSVGSDHANVHGGAEWQPETGVIDGALELDGTDDYIASMLILNPMDRPFRIIAWIKGGAPGQVIASQTADEFTPGSAYLAADPADGSLVTDLIFSNLALDSGVVITDNEWYEVGMEWDGQHRHLLVNGDQVAADEMDLPSMARTGWMNIGTGKDAEPGSFWSGLIDEVRVYVKGSGE
jgi:serine/threonine protein kinase/tetratricopeptide (TPR) repeat protein